MEEKRLREGCLVRFSSKHFTCLKTSNKTSEIKFSDSITAWFIVKIGFDKEHKDFLSKREIERLLFDCPTVMLYLDYWRSDMSFHNPFNEEVANKFVHHFNLLIEDSLYDYIFVAKKDFEIMELFEVLT